MCPLPSSCSVLVFIWPGVTVLWPLLSWEPVASTLGPLTLGLWSASSSSPAGWCRGPEGRVYTALRGRQGGTERGGHHRSPLPPPPNVPVTSAWRGLGCRPGSSDWSTGPPRSPPLLPPQGLRDPCPAGARGPGAPSPRGVGCWRTPPLPGAGTCVSAGASSSMCPSLKSRPPPCPLPPNQPPHRPSQTDVRSGGGGALTLPRPGEA